jgi:putative transposase
LVENRNARVVPGCWLGLPDHYPHVQIDAFVVMPDHVHGIVVLGGTHRAGSDRDGDARAGLKPAPTGCGPATYPGVHRGLPEVVRALKTFSARRINALRNTPGTPVWQRGYYERIIRSERELNLTRRYIETNPQRWQQNHETSSPSRKTNPS